MRSAFRRAAAGVVLAGFLGACAGTPSPVPRLATVTVTFDMGGGGAGFAATIYAQEVSTGKTFKSFYPAGSHGLVVLPTSAPVSLNVEAPGTYVFYATLIEAPDDYQYGATSCPPAEPCPPFITHQPDEMGIAHERYLGDGVVTGYGQIEGSTVYVYSQDFTVYGGTLSEMQSHKICRVMDLALRNGVPILGLIDSGGARFQEGVRSLGGYAEIFRRNALYSGVIPQISLLLGPWAGGAAYSPALTDLFLMVRKSSFMFLTGPEVIKGMTGEIIDAETLGGADTHLSISGTAHLALDSEQEDLAAARRLLGYFPSNNVENPPFQPGSDDPLRMDLDLDSIVPLDSYEPYGMHPPGRRGGLHPAATC